MNRVLVIILSVVMAGCTGGKQSTNELMVVDVTKRYPKKELILQDFFDVEYIVLETNDEFVTNGFIKYIGKDIIVATNTGMLGDIHIFDRNGKGLRKINRRGQGPEEYTSTSHLIVDEDENEMAIVCIFQQKVLIYDLYGNFKRRFDHNILENGMKVHGYLGNFDRDHFICQMNDGDMVNGVYTGYRNNFFIISKKDGSIAEEIYIPFHEKKFDSVVAPDGSRPFSAYPSSRRLIPYRNNWIVNDISSDTIYCVMPDYSLVPFIARTPPIQSIHTEVYLYPGVLTSRYCFMQTVKREYNFSTNTGWPRIDLVYDRQENEIFEYVVYNDDFLNKRPVKLSAEISNLTYPFQSNDISFFSAIEAFELVDAYKEGQLKGKLKEIAAGLDAEDNRVIMIAKYKK